MTAGASDWARWGTCTVWWWPLVLATGLVEVSLRCSTADGTSRILNSWFGLCMASYYIDNYRKWLALIRSIYYTVDYTSKTSLSEIDLCKASDNINKNMIMCMLMQYVGRWREIGTNHVQTNIKHSNILQRTQITVNICYFRYDIGVIWCKVIQRKYLYP